MRIDDTGNVGIGTSTPQKKFHVEHTAGASEGILISGASDTAGHTAGILLRAEGGEADSALRAKAGIFLERTATYGIGKLHIANRHNSDNVSATISDANITIYDDKVGIGTASPSRKLDVRGSVRFSVNTSTHETFTFTTQGVDEAKQIMKNASSVDTIILNTNGNTYFNGGKVGIGTSSPTVDLDVSGPSSSMVLPGTSGTTPKGFLRLGYNDRNWGGTELLMGVINDSSVGYAGYLQAKAPTNYSVNRNFVINPQGGNVGIGTASPAQKLVVQGTPDTTFAGSSVGVPALVNIEGDDGYASGTAGSGIVFTGHFTSSAKTTFGTIGAIKENTTSGNYGGALVFMARSNGQGGGAAENMRITSAGKVAIGAGGAGTSGTHTKLEVHGAIAAGSAQGTGGSLVLYQRYGVNDMPATLSTHYSNSYWLLATGMKARSGASGYVSSLGNYSTAKAGIEINNSSINYLYVPAATHAVDTVLTPRSPFYMNLDTGTLEFRTTSNNIRGYISAQETNTGGTHGAGLIIATSNGEAITFKDSGIGGTTNMVIDGAGRVGLPQTNQQLIVGSSAGTTGLYSTTSVPAIGIFGEGAYASCGAHIEIAADADIGWSPIYINKYDWQSGDDARWIAFGVNGFGTDSGTLSYDGTNFAILNGSDYRLKENIVDYSGGLAKIEELQVRSYNKKEGVSRDITQQGFIAHEAALANIPGLVLGAKDAMKEDEEGNTVPDYQTINREALIPYLVSAIQELTARVRELENS